MNVNSPHSGKKMKNFNPKHRHRPQLLCKELVLPKLKIANLMENIYFEKSKKYFREKDLTRQRVSNDHFSRQQIIGFLK